MSEQPLAARVHALIAQWRDAASVAGQWARKHELEYDGANAHAFRKERRIWNTCADALEAALAAAQGGADAMTDHDCFQSLVSMGSTDDHGRKRAHNECWLRCTKCRAQYAKSVVDAALAAALAPKSEECAQCDARTDVFGRCVLPAAHVGQHLNACREYFSTVAAALASQPQEPDK